LTHQLKKFSLSEEIFAVKLSHGEPFHARTPTRLGSVMSIRTQKILSLRLQPQRGEEPGLRRRTMAVNAGDITGEEIFASGTSTPISLWDLYPQRGEERDSDQGTKGSD
jgi:hypothetical protein